MKEPIVETQSGKVRGQQLGGVYRFLGIPYGANPSGHNRFKPVGFAEPWSGTRDALAYGPNCPQGEVDVHPEVMALAKTHDRTIVSDEAGCLVVNVWTPGLDSGRRPVMVWLHGGGYMVGSAAPKIYDGERIAAAGDAVIVSLNHRLNAFGHLYLAELGGSEFADSGNVGLLDIVLALRWVQANIDRFGGDPNNVTIFGVSGGGAKVAMLMTMPSAKGLFHKAIIQSGGGFWPRSPADTTETASAILDKLGLDRQSLHKIHDIPAESIVKATTDVMGALLAGGSTRGNMGPVLDGRSLLQHPFDPEAPDTAADIPLIIGTNRDEATMILSANLALFSLDDSALRKAAPMFLGADEALVARVVDSYRGANPQASPSDIFMRIASDRMFRMTAIALAESRVRRHMAPTYMYLLCWETPVWHGRLGATHALDVPFVFDNVDYMPLTGSGSDRAPLAKQISEAWLAFARTGTPTHSGIPGWDPYDLSNRSTMVFDRQTRIERDPGTAERSILQSLPLLPL